MTTSSVRTSSLRLPLVRITVWWRQTQTRATLWHATILRKSLSVDIELSAAGATQPTSASKNLIYVQHFQKMQEESYKVLLSLTVISIVTDLSWSARYISAYLSWLENINSINLNNGHFILFFSQVYYIFCWNNRRVGRGWCLRNFTRSRSRLFYREEIQGASPERWHPRRHS